jgi:proteasome accessory factor B
MPYIKHTHSLLERIQYIDACIRSGKQVNCTTAANHFGVSTDTIQRTIDHMRDRQGLPIEPDPVRNSYVYTEPVDSLPGITTTEGEVFALLVARAAFEQYRGTPFERQLAGSFGKLSAALKDKVSFSFDDLSHAVSFRGLGTAKIDAEVFKILSQGLKRTCEVEFDYRKPGTTEIKRRFVQPYHIAWRNNLCYLVGFDRERAKVITLALPRISRAEVTKKKFKVPADFSPQKFFARALSVMGGDGDYRIVIRFKGASADRVREREWHDSEKLRELPAGGLELELRLGALEEIERWVLAWGAEAEVIEPRELRDCVKHTIAELGKVYA